MGTDESSSSKQDESEPQDSLLGLLVDHELHLHTLSPLEIPSAIRNALETWQRRKPGAVLRITVAMDSPHWPVLRALVRAQLGGELRRLVRTFQVDERDRAFKVRVR